MYPDPQYWRNQLVFVGLDNKDFGFFCRLMLRVINPELKSDPVIDSGCKSNSLNYC